VSRDAGDDRVTCWRPSSRAKLDVWKSIVDGAVLQGIDLEKQFLARDLWRSILDDGGEEPFPRPLFDAVLKRVCESEDSPSSAVAEPKCEST
jgi:sister chromatid cohesion protein DCC1